MSEADRVVAVISPWEKIADVVKNKFRMQTLPTEKRVIVWRDDLQDDQQLTGELAKIGVKVLEVRKRRTTDWKETD